MQDFVLTTYQTYRHMPFLYAEPASPITGNFYGFHKTRSPTRLGSDLHKFLLHTELPPSSARLDLSEKLLSSSLPFQIYFIHYLFYYKIRFLSRYFFRLFGKCLKKRSFFIFFCAYVWAFPAETIGEGMTVFLLSENCGGK